MAVRFRIIHRERVGAQVTEYRADILDSAYSGSVHEVLARDTFFDWDYDIIEPRRVMDTPVQKSGFTVNLLLNGQLEMDLLNDILDADEVRFQIIFYINGTPQWYGNVLTDLIEYDETEYKGVGRIRAKDLTILEGKDYPVVEVATRTRLIEIIAECLLQTGHSLPIRTFTNLTHANANIDQNADFLYSLYHQKLALQNESGPMTCYEVLENICRAYNLIIRQGAARWIIEQLPAVAKGNAWQFDYNANGGSPSTTQNPSRAIPIDGENSFIIPGTMNKVTGALKRITSTYNHRTKLDPFELPDEVVRSSEFGNPEEFDRDVQIVTGDVVQFKAQAQVTVSNPGSFMTGSAFVRIIAVRIGEPDFYMTQSGEFQRAPATVAIPVSGGSSVLTGSLNLSATMGTITKPFTALKIQFLWGQAQEVSNGPQKFVTQVKYIKPELIAGEPERDWRASSQFTYTMDGNFSASEEIRSTVLGDGPQPFSKGIPAHGTLVSTDLEPGFFRIRGESEFVNLQEITLRERMNMRRAPMRMLQANLMMRFSPANLVNYDNRSWFFLGGHFEANGSQWRADLLSFDYLGGVGDDFSDFDPPSGGGSSITVTINDLRRLLGITRAIGVTTADYDDVDTSVIEANLTAPMRSGAEYWIVNTDELNIENLTEGIYPVVPLFGAGNERIDYQTGFIDIETQRVNAPAFSLIFRAPGQEEMDDNTGEEKDQEFDERVEELNEELDQLEIDLGILNTVTLPALQEELDQLEIDLEELNDVTLPALQSDLTNAENAINTLNDVTLPNLQSELDSVLPITEVKIANDSISAPKLQANSVIAGKIAANAVVANSIAADAVTANKIQAGAVIAGKIGADAVTANSIAADAVTANKIQAGAVIAGKIGADAVTANTIAAGSITTNKIGAAAVTAQKINVADLAASSAFIEELMAKNLTLRSGGKITNTSGDFQIDIDGIYIREVPSGSQIVGSRSYRILTSDDHEALLIYAQPGSVHIEKGQGSGVGNRTLFMSFNGYQLTGIPTSNPGGFNRIWNDNGTLKIT